MSSHAVLAPAASRSRPVVRASQGAPMLTAAMIASGVLTYAFLVLAARTLDTDAYGRIGVLWGATFLVAIVLFRPLEQTVSRAVADRLARGQEARSPLRSVGVVTAVLLVVTTLAAAIGWSTISSRLFDGSNFMTAALLAGIVAYGSSYVVRGVLGGVRWFGGYGVALMADGSLRLLLALPLLFFTSLKVAAAGVAIAGLGGVVAPLMLGRKRLAGALAGNEGAPFAIGTALRFAGPATVIAAADQLLVNGAPLLVTIDHAPGSSSAAGLVFAATMLVRAPVWIFQGFAASLLPNLTHIAATTSARGFQTAVVRTTAWLLAAGVALIVGTAALGPTAMHLVYGTRYEAPTLDLALLAAGVACYLAAGTFSQGLLALGRGRVAAPAWGAAALLFAGSYFFFGGSPLLRVAGALAAGSFLAACTLGGTLLRARP